YCFRACYCWSCGSPRVDIAGRDYATVARHSSRWRMSEELKTVCVLEQTHPQILGKINVLAIAGHTPIGDTHNQLAFNHALEIDVIGHLFGGGQYLTGKFHFAATQCAPAPAITLPAEEKAHQLPHGIQAQATGHNRVAGKVAIEKPEVRTDIQLRDNFALAELAAGLADVHYAVEHQHIGHGQLGVTWAKQIASAALQ